MKRYIKASSDPKSYPVIMDYVDNYCAENGYSKESIDEAVSDFLHDPKNKEAVLDLAFFDGSRYEDLIYDMRDDMTNLAIEEIINRHPEIENTI